MNAGATPKLITSVNESNSFPTFDVALINLAILPSKPSIIAAIKTAITDNSNLSSNANLIELFVQPRFQSISTLSGCVTKIKELD